MRFRSPLRYPGGKARLAPFLSSLLRNQRPRPDVYAEPFAGGAGAALELLTSEVVDRIVLNDLNPGVAAFWRAVFKLNEDFVQLIRTVPLTLDEWHRQREVYESSVDDLELGFATFYLNRTNRSGILNARPIGGLDQSGKWKIDARFNRNDLADRCEFLANYAERVDIQQRDGRRFIKSLGRLGANVFLYVDPPYLQQGEELYMNHMVWDDHVRLSSVLRASQAHWVLTYDYDSRVPDKLYINERCAKFSLAHSAAKQHFGSEYLILAPSLRSVPLTGFGPRPGSWVRA